MYRSLSPPHENLPYRVSLPSCSAPSVASESRDNDDNISVEGVRISPNQIPHGVYQEQSNNRRTSPTASEVNFVL